MASELPRGQPVLPSAHLILTPVLGFTRKKARPGEVIWVGLKLWPLGLQSFTVQLPCWPHKFCFERDRGRNASILLCAPTCFYLHPSAVTSQFSAFPANSGLFFPLLLLILPSNAYSQSSQPPQDPTTPWFSSGWGKCPDHRANWTWRLRNVKVIRRSFHITGYISVAVVCSEVAGQSRDSSPASRGPSKHSGELAAAQWTFALPDTFCPQGRWPSLRSHFFKTLRCVYIYNEGMTITSNQIQSFQISMFKLLELEEKTEDPLLMELAI